MADNINKIEQGRGVDRTKVNHFLDGYFEYLMKEVPAEVDTDQIKSNYQTLTRGEQQAADGYISQQDPALTAKLHQIAGIAEQHQAGESNSHILEKMKLDESKGLRDKATLRLRKRLEAGLTPTAPAAKISLSKPVQIDDAQSGVRDLTDQLRGGEAEAVVTVPVTETAQPGLPRRLVRYDGDGEKVVAPATVAMAKAPAKPAEPTDFVAEGYNEDEDVPVNLAPPSHPAIAESGDPDALTNETGQRIEVPSDEEVLGGGIASAPKTIPAVEAQASTAAAPMVAEIAKPAPRRAVVDKVRALLRLKGGRGEITTDNVAGL